MSPTPNRAELLDAIADPLDRDAAADMSDEFLRALAAARRGPFEVRDAGVDDVAACAAFADEQTIERVVQTQVAAHAASRRGLS